MAEETTDRIPVLSAYSAGDIGWREACKKLVLMDLGELHEELREAGIALPADEEDNREESATTRRFTDLLKKKGDGFAG